MHANRSISEILPWLVNETGPYDNASSNFSTFQFIPELKQPVHMIVIYSAAYLVIFLLGLLGNTLVVLVVYRNVRMHNVTNYFIVNLAVADILVCLLCLPISLLQNLYAGEYMYTKVTELICWEVCGPSHYTTSILSFCVPMSLLQLVGCVPQCYFFNS